MEMSILIIQTYLFLVPLSWFVFMIINMTIIYMQMVRTYIKKIRSRPWCPEKTNEVVIKITSRELTLRQTAQKRTTDFTQSLILCKGELFLLHMQLSGTN